MRTISWIALSLLLSTAASSALEITRGRIIPSVCEGEYAPHFEDIELQSSTYRCEGDESAIWRLYGAQKVLNRRLKALGEWHTGQTRIYYLNEILTLVTGVSVINGSANTLLEELTRFVVNLPPQGMANYFWHVTKDSVAEILFQYPELKSIQDPRGKSIAELQVWYQKIIGQIGTRYLVIYQDPRLPRLSLTQEKERLGEIMLSEHGATEINLNPTQGSVQIKLPPDLNALLAVETPIDLKHVQNEATFARVLDLLSWKAGAGSQVSESIQLTLDRLPNDQQRLKLVQAIHDYWDTDAAAVFAVDAFLAAKGLLGMTLAPKEVLQRFQKFELMLESYRRHGVPKSWHEDDDERLILYKL